MARVDVEDSDLSNSDDEDNDDNDDDIEEGDNEDYEGGDADSSTDGNRRGARTPREPWIDRMHSLLKGRTVGRRLKREVFRCSVVSLLGAVLLILLAIAGGSVYPNTRWYGQPIVGAPQLALQHLVSWPQLLFSSIGLSMVHHWATIVTNTELLTRLCTYFMYACLLWYPFWVWCCVSTFVVFGPVTIFGPYGPGVETLYVLTIIAVLPHSALGLLSVTNISYFLSQVREGATVLEPPEEQAKASDVSQMNLEEFIRFMATRDGETRIDSRSRRYQTASGPIGFVLLAGLAIVRYSRHFLEQRVRPNLSQSRATTTRRGRTPKQTSPQSQPHSPHQSPRQSAPNKDLMAVSTLSPVDFQRVWQMLPQGGRFECQLTEFVLAVNMEQHLKSRGFQVQTSDYGNAWDITLFNQRTAHHRSCVPQSSIGAKVDKGECFLRVEQTPSEPWFLGEMTVDSSLKFEATLKCTEEARVPDFVKEFQLADVLKIAK